MDKFEMMNIILKVILVIIVYFLFKPVIFMIWRVIRGLLVKVGILSDNPVEDKKENK